MHDLVTIKQPENWIHYSSSSAAILMKTKYQQNGGDREIFFKPKGLWITPEYADNNWYEWCRAEKFREGDLNFIHDVKFKPTANLLRLENADDIDRFTAEYGYDVLRSLSPRFLDRFGPRYDGIHWKKVAEKYHGILIPNYIYERRLMNGADWYYPWDCASGCIWDADAVESITLRSTVSAGLVSKVFDLKIAMANIRDATATLQKEMHEKVSAFDGLDHSDGGDGG